MLAVSAGGRQRADANLQFRISEKLIQVPFSKVGIQQNTLAWGKLPRVGTDEVLAGADVGRQERIQVAETNYTVTGGLPRTAGLFARCYVLPAEERSRRTRRRARRRLSIGPADPAHYQPARGPCR